MGRMIPIYNPEAVDPPEDPPFVGKCPSCGTPLNWDDEVVVLDVDGSVIGCQYCTTRRDAGEVFNKEEE